MDEAAALEALAARHGLAAGFHDIWGEWHAASAQTLRALIGCMRSESDPTPGLLPRIVVRRGGQTGEPLVLRLPGALTQAGLELQVQAQDGTQRREPLQARMRRSSTACCCPIWRPAITACV